MSDAISIRVEGLWKHYGLSSRPGLGQIARAVLPQVCRGPMNGDAEFWALRDVSFEVRRGETVGIIGRNGAGKSTLLKVLAGVTPPSRGRVEVHGRIFPMIELNAGVHPELTGRENTYLLGAIMGVPGEQMTSLLPEIEEFVELGDWFDRPVRTYSSGMVARLGFGVATRIESDILLIDETFAVGDLKFQNKSLARIKELRERGATVILVTHSLDMLQFIAQRGIVLDEGAIVAEGSALEGLRAYEQLVFGKERLRLAQRGRSGQAAKELTMVSTRIFGPGEETLTEVEAGAPFGIEIRFRVHRLLDRPVFSVGVLNATGVVCVWNVSEEDGLQCEGVSGAMRLRIWYDEHKLSKGAYEVNFALREQTSYETLERLAGIASFSVTGSGRARGIMALPAQWRLCREQDHT
ncbi:MAG TPA: ABC transporter ATP-binding protein [Nitrospira sp.]|nr:ABC transporter ATP-binding protein [Nitrospira sp.]